MAKAIPPSELIINGDGSVFHLRLKPGEAAEKIILVGDPGRVGLIARRFNHVETRVANREFVTATGTVNGERITALSTGIGTDNIDIVMTELDALYNVDFTTRTVCPHLKKLWITRLGTSGALQPDIEAGTCLLSKTSIGLDGAIRYYAGSEKVRDLELERDFMERLPWPAGVNPPYAVHASPRLCELYTDFTEEGITLSAPGFYGAQGREVRLPLAAPNLNRRLEDYRYRGRRITNYEMEGSALAAMAAMLGHEAVTVCTVIAQRVGREARTDYGGFIDRMIDLCLEKLVNLNKNPYL
ncbi:MAG: nucleoside phosphorylase [Rikenellaceae bacterium]|jgi:uridine phosphorylase|nr:nucleoside phosphorylase [Rikenellaceae bacterium]